MIKNNKSGFTLIELLLYVSMAAILLSVIVSFLIMSLQARVKNQTIAEVDGQGIQAMQVIRQAIANADTIDSPSAGLSSTSLSLDSAATIFDLSAGQLRIDEGGGPIELTSSNVVVSGLTFENLSKTDTPGIIRIEFNVAYDSQSDRSEYSYDKTFYTSVSLLGS